MCRSGKISYSSRTQAKRNARNGRLKGELHPYKCRFCSQWHLSSKIRIPE